MDSGKAVKSIAFIIIFSIGTKLLGFLREILIASKFGAGNDADTFFIAVAAVNILAIGLKRTISTTLIPVLSIAGEKEGSIGKAKHVNNMVNVFILAGTVVVVIGIIITPLLARVIAVGFTGDQHDLLVRLIRIGLPVIVFSCVVGVFRGYLQSESKFREFAFTDIPFNLTYILYLLFLSHIFGIEGLMVAGVIAVILQLLIQVPGIKSIGYKYKSKVDIGDSYIKHMFSLMPPVLIMTAMNDINKIVDRSLASTLVEGSVSALSYGHRLESMIMGIFITSITTVVFPIMSKEAARDNIDGLKTILKTGVNTITLITVPATVGMIVLSRPIVEIAFMRGAFDQTAAEMTIGALIFYSIGILGLSIRTILSRVYYSIHDTRTPMLNSFISVALNIVFNLVLIRYLGHMGLALGTSLAATITTIIMLFDLNKKLGKLDYRSMVSCLLKSFASSAIMGLAAYIAFNFIGVRLSSNFYMQVISLFLTISIGIVVYLLLIKQLKVEEFNWLYKSVVRKVRREITSRKD